MKYTNRRSDGCQQPTLCAAAPPTLQALRFAASRSCRLRSSMRLRTRDSTLDLFCILNSVACHAQFNLDMQPQQGGLPWDPPACLCPPASKVEALHGPTPLGLTPHAPLFLQPNSASDSHCVHCKQGGQGPSAGTGRRQSTFAQRGHHWQQKQRTLKGPSAAT